MPVEFITQQYGEDEYCVLCVGCTLDDPDARRALFTAIDQFVEERAIPVDDEGGMWMTRADAALLALVLGVPVPVGAR